MLADKKISALFKQFCDDTSIHGLRFMNGTNVKRNIIKLVWTIIFLLMLWLFIWQCYVSIKEYLEFKVATSITYDMPLEVQSFPAITLCPRNVLKRSVASRSPSILALASAVFKHDTSWSSRWCPKPNKTTDVNITEFEDPIRLLQKVGINRLLNMVMLSSNDTVERCWFKEVEIECNTILHNHFTDNGWCVTLNPSTIENEMFTKMFGVKNNDDTYNDYLLNATNYGRRNSLSVLLNTNQDEYCGSFYQHDIPGAGFIGFIHDQSEAGSVQQRSNMYLHPGKSYDIVIKPKVFIRQTESLGFCRSITEVKELNLRGNYSFSACKLACFMKQFYDNCKCFPFFASSATELLSSILNIKKSDMKMCTEFSDIQCCSEVGDDFEKGHFTCDCISQCTETVYDYFLTKNYFPPKNMENFFLNKTFDEKNLRKNYLMINIYFDSMNPMTITETQAYTLIDLLNAVGGALGLFLGMSLISPFEPIHEIAFLIHAIISHCVKRKTNPKLTSSNFSRNGTFAQRRFHNSVIASRYKNKKYHQKLFVKRNQLTSIV